MCRSLFLVLLSTVCTFAPSQAQVLVTPVDASTTPVYFCEGARINTVSISYGVLNLGDKTVHVDSVTFHGTRNAFTDLSEAGSSYSAGPHSFMVATGGPTYAPPSIGFDTCWATAYVGADTTTSLFVCSALASPSYSLLGNIEYDRNYGIFAFGGTVREQLTDTLVDIMQHGPSYRVSTSAQPHDENGYVCFFACAGAEIDSIVPRDTFSEFTFHDLPSGPVSVKAGDSLVIRYDFTPSLVGKHSRPLVFYLHDGGRLVWLFDYTVQAARMVREDENLSAGIYPNPASTKAILAFPSAGQDVEIEVLDASGRTVARRMTRDVDAVTIPLDALASGPYTVVATNKLWRKVYPLIIRH